jgi:hypothetical protein
MAEEKLSGKLPFKEQCYLTWNIATFIDQNASNVYENLGVIEGNPTDVINKLITTKVAPRLLNLTPAEISAMVPLIRLYKTDFGPNKETAEIKFNTVLSKSSIENMTLTRVGRGDGIGIKSVTYDLQGGSTTGGAALVEGGNTEVNITFSFQNLEMLVQREGNSPALIDLVSLPPGAEENPPKCQEGAPINYSDLFDPAHFGLKLVFGFATPQHVRGDLIDSTLKEVLEKSRTSLKLSLVTHEMDFRQDGTIELKCRYQGFANAIMGSPKADLLYIGDDRERDPNIERNEDVTNNRNELIEQEKQRREGATTEQQQKEIDEKIAELEEERNEAQQAADEAREEQDKNDKVFVYKRLLQGIYDSGKVFFIDLSKEDIENHMKEIGGEELDTTPVPSAPASGDYFEGTSEEQLEAIRERLDETGGFGLDTGQEAYYQESATSGNPQQAGKGQLLNEGSTDLDGFYLGSLFTGPVAIPAIGAGKIYEYFIEDDDAGDVLGQTDLDSFKESLSEYSANKQSEKKEASETRINYIYYGDLLDIAFSVFRKDKNAKNIKPMLGPIEYSDPKGGSGRRIANLADIPISLKKFVEWFNLNVVGQNRDSYILEDFVRDTIKHLIHAALGENCFTDTNTPLPEPNVSIIPIEVPKVNGVSAIPFGQRVQGESVEIREGTEYKDSDRVDQYLYIYSYSFGASQLEGQQEKDALKGIYHLHVGSNKGLVKKVTFSRIDDPQLNASRLTTQQCNLRYLRQNYKVNIAMIGNSLFKPGQTIYIDPTLAGGTDPQVAQRVANDLGLGGYYTVTKVGGELSRDGFVTDVEAVWESPRFSDRPATKPVKKLPTETLVEPGTEIDASPTGGTGNLLTGKL